MAAPHYRIEPHSPWRRGIQWLLVSVSFVLIAWSCYELGKRVGGYRRHAQDAQAEAPDRLRTQVVEAEKQRAALVSKLAFVERSTQVELQACEAMKQSLTEMQTEIEALREELAFYKTVMAPSALRPGLRLQAFHIERARPAGRYLYKLVLMQTNANRRKATGTVDFSIQGSHDGKSSTLAYAQVNGQRNNTMRFGFKYFQTIEGSVTIPEGFEPERIKVMVTPTTTGLAAIEHSYSWRELFE